MQVHQSPTELDHPLEQLVIGSERDPGKVDAQKLSILLPVGRCIEHGVHVVKDVLARRFLVVGLRQFLDQLGVQVGLSLTRLISPLVSLEVISARFSPASMLPMTCGRGMQMKPRERPV